MHPSRQRSLWSGSGDVYEKGRQTSAGTNREWCTARAGRAPSAHRRSMALLVLLATATGAGIVPSDLGAVVAHGLDDVIAARASRLRCKRARVRLPCSGPAWQRRGSAGLVQDEGLAATRRLLPRGRSRLLFCGNRTQPPEVPHDILVDARTHRLEQLEALPLVLDERIALAVPPQ